MNFEEVFKCIICTEDYNQQQHQPMMICNNYHTICRICLNNICKDNKHNDCPICRAKISKKEAVYLGCFFQYRDEAKSLLLQYLKLQNETKQLTRQLQICSQKKPNLGKVQLEVIKQTKQLRFYQQQIKKMQKKIEDNADCQQQLESYINRIENECEELKKQSKICKLQYENLQKKSKVLEQSLKKTNDQKSQLYQKMKIITNRQNEKQQLKKQISRINKEFTQVKQINKEISDSMAKIIEQKQISNKLLQKKNKQFDQLSFQYKQKCKKMKEQKLEHKKIISSFKDSQEEAQKATKQAQYATLQSLKVFQQVQRLKNEYQLKKANDQQMMKQQAAKIQQYLQLQLRLNSEKNQLETQLTDLVRQNKQNVLQISILKKSNNDLIRLKKGYKEMIMLSEVNCKSLLHKIWKLASQKQIVTSKQIHEILQNQALQFRNGHQLNKNLVDKKEKDWQQCNIY